MDGPFAFRIERSLCYAFFRLRRATPTSPNVKPIPSSASEDGSGTVFSVIASESVVPVWLMLTRMVVGVESNPAKFEPGSKTPSMKKSRKLADCRSIEPLVAVNLPQPECDSSYPKPVGLEPFGADDNKVRVKRF